jgi:hypothetical protein
MIVFASSLSNVGKGPSQFFLSDFFAEGRLFGARLVHDNNAVLKQIISNAVKDGVLCYTLS